MTPLIFISFLVLPLMLTHPATTRTANSRPTGLKLSRRNQSQPSSPATLKSKPSPASLGGASVRKFSTGIYLLGILRNINIFWIGQHCYLILHANRYNPEDPEAWISNAFSSLKSIATTYHLDGIDIDYENFPKHNSSSFAYCMGQLITLLKNQSVISVATIAPFYTTVPPYIDLFSKYGAVIDYVNYQFYTDKVKNPGGYLKAFALRAKQFDREKVLPSYEVNGRGIQGDGFFEALRLLEENGFDVNGVMIFSADASMSNGYYYEKKSQAFLLNSTRV